MADADVASEPKRLTIAASANKCLESFQQCLLWASSVHPRELSMTEDQVARFSTWTTGIGVFALGRASMDHRLRYAPEVQSVVTSLLESLNYRIRTCSDVLGVLGKFPGTNAPSVPRETLERSFGDIATEISHLNKISNTIRRASKEAQILKASDFQIKDDDGYDVEPLLLGHFVRHIRDRFPNISNTIQQRLARAMLLRRKRILHRRHRQGNTAIRPQKAVPKASVTLPAARPTVPSAQGSLQQDDGQVAAVAATTIVPSQIKSATTLPPDKFKIATSSPSIISESKTVALGNHEPLNFPPAPGLAAKRKYEQLKSQRLAVHQTMLDDLEVCATMDSRKDPTLSLTVANKVAEGIVSVEAKLNDTLKSDLQAIGEITCPYCLYALPAEEVFDERKWQNHVKNDLDPYVCLVEDCDQPDELYSHSDGWLSHLHQHGQRWRCSSHRELGPFSTREEYIQHMREAHNTKLSDTQLRVLANRNTRKMAKLFPSCPLCGKDKAEVDGDLEDHITGHLRSLALKSLPCYQDEIPNDAGSGKDSVDASRPQSRSTVKNLGDDEDMLAFGTEHFWDHWTPQLTETNPTNFLGDAHLELDLSHEDAGMASWNFDKLASQKPLWSLEDDPILQSMLQQKKDKAKVIDIREKNSSDLPADQEAGDLSKAPRDEAEAIVKLQLEEGAELETKDKDSRTPLAWTAERGHEAEVKLGADHPSTLISMADLVSTYRDQGRWDAAKELDVQVMETRKKELGADHPDTLTSIANLASTYWNQGRWDDAEKLEVQVMETRKTKLGVDQPVTLTSMANLASIYRNQGRWDAAEKLEMQVMEIRKTKLGVDQPVTLTSMANLASIYRNQGRWDAAEKLEVQVMEIRKKKLGVDHPDTLTSMANLASTYRDQGRWDAAEELEIQVIEIRKKKLGVDYPDTLTSMANLASTYRDQGRWDVAEELEVQVMEIRKTKLGIDHPDTLTSMTNLASTYRDQGRWDAAEELEVQVMEIRKTKLGVDYPDTLTSMANLASMYRDQGRWDAAEELEVQVMEIRKTKLGIDHPDTLTSIANLASTYRDQGRWDAAEELEVQVMEIRKTKLGIDHPDTLTSIANLASTYRDQGRWDAVEELEVQVMEIRKTKLGIDHPETLTSMANLASTYRDQGRWDAAEELEIQVIEIRKTKLGVDHPDTLTSMANLASTYRDQGRWDAAEELEVQVMEIRKTKLGIDYPDTLISMTNLASTYRDQGRWDAAEELEVQVMEIRKTKLGVDYPDTLTSMANLASTYGRTGSRPVGRCRRAGRASHGDSQDEARSRPPRHADEHGQPGIDI